MKPRFRHLDAMLRYVPRSDVGRAPGRWRVYLFILWTLILASLFVEARTHAATSFPEIILSGYTHIRWQYDSRKDHVPNNEFRVQRARFKVQARLSERIKTTLSVDFAKAAAVPKDVMFRYKPNAHKQVILGQFKMPFSREELTSSSKLWLTERGEANETFEEYGYLGRDVGVLIEGKTGKYRRASIEYAVGMFNGTGYKTSGDIDHQKQYVGRVELRLGDWSLGVHRSQRSDSMSVKAKVAHGADLSYKKKKWAVEGEVLVGDTEGSSRMVGAHFLGVYRQKAFEPVLKIEGFDPAVDYRNDARVLVSVGLNVYVHKKARLQSNWIWVVPQYKDAYHKFILQAQARY